MRNFKFLPVFVALLAVTSCLPKSVENTVYTIRTEGSDEASKTCKNQTDIQVTNPSNDPGLDTRRIAVLQDGQQINYYNGVRWAAPVADMVQGLLVGKLEKSGGFSSVSTDEDPANANLFLVSDIRDFYVEQGSNKVHVNIVAKLINAASRDVIATIPVSKVYAPKANNMEGIVKTFNSAANDAVSDIVAKAAKIQCNASRPE